MKLVSSLFLSSSLSPPWLSFIQLLLGSCILLLLTTTTTNTVVVMALPGTVGSTIDSSSSSNIEQFIPSHISFNMTIDFNQFIINGIVTHTFTVLQSNVTTVYVDIWGSISIRSVEFIKLGNATTTSTAGDAAGVTVPFTITTPNPNTGIAVGIELPEEMIKGTQFLLTFTYVTYSNSTGANFLPASQTGSKNLAFLYSLCQLNFCRDFAPMMDTPSAKITYDATVTVPKGYVVLMSANQTSNVSSTIDDTLIIYTFNCTIKLSPYLIAITAGDLVEVKLNDKVSIISEPYLINDAVAEFSNLPTFFNETQNYLTPYIWGKFSLLFMPPSFAFGGMEHPIYTILTPTLVAGDKSLVSVVIHELCHSWFGNDVTNQNWNYFWINEGFNTFMERKMLSILYDIDVAHDSYYAGNISMYETMVYYGLNDSYSSLYPDIGTADPDDSFSTIPYEKGSQFLYWVETLIGEDSMQALLRLVLTTYGQSNMNNDQFLELYTGFVNTTFNTTEATRILNETNFDVWIYQPGLPPVTHDFLSDGMATAIALATEYVSLGGTSSPATFTLFKDLTPVRKVAFLRELYQQEGINANLLAYIDNDLNLTNETSPYVKNYWYEIGLKNNYEPVKDPAFIWLGEMGLGWFVTGIFYALVDGNQCNTAVTWYETYKTVWTFYVVAFVESIIQEPCANVTATITTTSSPVSMPVMAPTTKTTSAGTFVAPNSYFVDAILVLYGCLLGLHSIYY